MAVHSPIICEQGRARLRSNCILSGDARRRAPCGRRIASDNDLLLRRVWDRQILAVRRPRAARRDHRRLSMTRAAPRWPRWATQDLGLWRKIDVILHRGLTCESVTIKGDKGTPITAYVARPSGHGPFPGVVLVHHLPSAGASSTSRRRVGSRITAISHSRQPIRARGGRQATATWTTSPPRRSAEAALPTPRWSPDTWGRREVDHACPLTTTARCWSHQALPWRAARLHLRLPTEGRRCLRRTMGRGRVVMGKEELNAKDAWLT